MKWRKYDHLFCSRHFLWTGIIVVPSSSLIIVLSTVLSIFCLSPFFPCLCMTAISFYLFFDWEITCAWFISPGSLCLLINHRWAFSRNIPYKHYEKQLGQNCHYTQSECRYWWHVLETIVRLKSSYRSCYFSQHLLSLVSDTYSRQHLSLDEQNNTVFRRWTLV